VHRSAGIDCDNFNIAYGNYCGVGHTGCEGAKPCDEYDACCEQHDACVGKTSITDNVCHQSLNQCLDVALKANAPVWKKVEGQPGPQNKCKAKMLVKTMSEGMNLASMFGEMFGGMNSINMGEL
jgi:hypothetical protein